VLRHGRHVLVCLHGEVDLLAAPDAWAAMEPVLVPGDTVVVDMTDVSFIDSSGLNLLLQAHQAVAPDGAVTIRSASDQTRQVFAVTGLDRVFTLEA
jgi:anti-sigma B factor antagonist